MKTLVLGLGNPILGDDAVGLRVAKLVRERLGPDSPIEVDEEHCGGLSLMERMVGYDRAVLVDAAAGGGSPGTLRRLGPEDLTALHTASAHDVSLATALRLGASMGLPVPADVRIVAIEAESVFEFREALTPRVEAAVPGAVQAVLAEVADVPPKEGP